MASPHHEIESDTTETELFRVLEVLQPTEKQHMPLVVAGTLATRGILRWYEDTPRNRQAKIGPALDEGKRVETLKDGKGRQLLLISDIEAVPEGSQIMIDGHKPVVGIDGEQVPAAELLMPGDVIEIRHGGDDLTVNLVDLADAV